MKTTVTVAQLARAQRQAEYFRKKRLANDERRAAARRRTPHAHVIAEMKVSWLLRTRNERRFT